MCFLAEFFLGCEQSSLPTLQNTVSLQDIAGQIFRPNRLQLRVAVLLIKPAELVFIRVCGRFRHSADSDTEAFKPWNLADRSFLLVYPKQHGRTKPKYEPQTEILRLVTADRCGGDVRRPASASPGNHRHTRFAQRHHDHQWERPPAGSGKVRWRDRGKRQGFQAGTGHRVSCRPKARPTCFSS